MKFYFFSEIVLQSLLLVLVVLSSWGPLGQDVESLILFMKSVLVPNMYHLDPVLPVMPFRDEVCRCTCISKYAIQYKQQFMHAVAFAMLIAKVTNFHIAIHLTIG